MTRPFGLIPAAGKGTRAYPYTKTVPKGMLRVTGLPLLEHSVRLLRDEVGVERVFIVVGTLGEVIREHFGDGSRFGVPIDYVQNNDIDKGLAWSVKLAGRYIDRPFVTLLSDEYYQDTNHALLGSIPLGNELGWCGVMHSQEWPLIRRNYTLRLEGGRITRILEKPKVMERPLLGTGTLLLSPRVFDFLEQGFARGETPDFIGTLDRAIQENEEMRPFLLTGHYVNVNDVDSLNWANFLGKSKILPQVSHSVVVLASGGGGLALRRTVEEFAEQPGVNEVVVSAQARTTPPDWAAENAKVAWLAAQEGHEEYGEMLARGIEATRGDVVTLVEGSYNFYPTDLKKLTAYLADADMVLGTRTTRQLIQQGASMRGLVRVAHVLLAKLIEALWITHHVRLTDVGCTYRTIWRHAYDLIKGSLASPGPEFILEMTLETLISRQRLIEVPVSYLRTDQALARRHQTMEVFAGMLMTVLKARFPKLREVLGRKGGEGRIVGDQPS